MIYAAVILIITRFRNIYGSTLDWQAQHWAIPEYFRTLFYDTGELTPGFAFNLGAGQNIYYFSYYGLLSPIVLFSYLLPQVAMADYMIAASILSVTAATVLLYLRLRRTYTLRVSFLSSLLFVCSGSLIFHSHRHIMFVIYMPFLILALNGVDRLLEKKKPFLLMLSVFLIIMSSYFFSVGAIATVAVYAIYKVLRGKERFFSKKTAGLALGFCGSLLASVAAAAVLLLPTAYTLICGRDSANVNIRPSELLIPSVKLEFLVYSPYSLGLSAVLVFVMFEAMVSKRRHDVFLSICLFVLSVIPAVVYFFNGTLYIDAKVLIPFLPVAAILIADFLVQLEGEGLRKRIILPVLLFGVSGIVSYSENTKYAFVMFIIETLAYAAVLMLKNRTLSRRLFEGLAVLSALLCVVMINLQDELVPLDEFKGRFTDGRDALIERAADNEDTVVRISDQRFTMEDVNRVCGARHYASTLYSSVYNKRYNSFFHSVIQNENPYRNSAIISQPRNILFDIIMGAKYLVSADMVPAGYKQVAEAGGLSLYRNDDAFPVGFSSSRVLSEEEFAKLDYPYAAEALLQYIVVDGEGQSYDGSIEKTDWVLYSLLSESSVLTKKKGVVTVSSASDFTAKVQLPDVCEGKIMFISFDVDNTFAGKDLDTYIKINGMQNKLTCSSWKYYNGNTRFCYALSSNDSFDALNILFSKGEYRLSNMQVYTLDYSKIAELRSGLDELDFDMDRTHGDVIAGTINCRQDGWFELTVPYDEGFSVLVDGVKREYEMVDKAFIGFPLEKGEHDIEITFTPPLQKEGKALSLVGLLIIAAAGLVEAVFLLRKKTYVK